MIGALIFGIAGLLCILYWDPWEWQFVLGIVLGLIGWFFQRGGGEWLLRQFEDWPN